MDIAKIPAKSYSCRLPNKNIKNSYGKINEIKRENKKTRIFR